MAAAGTGKRDSVPGKIGDFESQHHLAESRLVPHADVPTYLAAADILLSPHGRQADGGEFFGSPTKLYEYMAAGRAE